MEFNFEENRTVADLASVPEKFRGLYVESNGDDGKVYTLSDSVAGLVESYVGTSKALESARADKKKAGDESAARRQALKKVSEFVAELGLDESDDPVESLRTHFTTLSESVKNGKEIQINLDKIKKDYETRMLEQEKAFNDQLSEKDSALTRHLIQDVATRELAAAKGSVDLLLPHVKNHCKVVKSETGEYEVRVVDGQGDFRSNGSGGWMGVKDLVGEMKNAEAFGRAFESETKGGTGSPPGGMQRPIITGNQEEKSSVNKIAEGLSQGKKTYGAGALA